MAGVQCKIRGLESIAYYFEDGSFETIYGTQVVSVDAKKFRNSMRNGDRTVSIGIGPDGERSAVIGVPFEIQMPGWQGKHCHSRKKCQLNI